jgi:hypothetical protein
MHHRLSRLRIVTACCGAVVAAFVLKHTVAFAQNAGTCGWSHSAAGCAIDVNGCEVVEGVGAFNSCNSIVRPDGSTILISHSVGGISRPGAGPDSSFTFGGSAGTTAYATLYCMDGDPGGDRNTAIHRGSAGITLVKTCSTLAFRSVCGPYPVCGDNTITY